MNKEIQRAQQFANQNWNDAMPAAQKQCKLIKNKDKAWNRYVACKQLATGDNTRKMNSVAGYFLDIACDLCHERAISFK